MVDLLGPTPEGRWGEVSAWIHLEKFTWNRSKKDREQWGQTMEQWGQVSPWMHPTHLSQLSTTSKRHAVKGRLDPLFAFNHDNSVP